MSDNKIEQMKMVAWYSPKQLLDTGVKTVISTIIGENADPRLISATTETKIFDYTYKLESDGFDFKPSETKRDEIWIDYVSDLGDGWNPTYSVAYCVAKEKIQVSETSLDRGGILIFGGDGVYPTANAQEYEKRLVTPYRTAFETVGKTGENGVELERQPHIFALPGNHDWYDSLVAFQKLFFTHIFNQRLFAGGWRTRQQRSYFALKLPHKWWLLGVDLQLQHNIDVPQLKYFERVANEMKAGDKIIFCVPEPYWVKALKYRGITDKFEKKEQSIEKIEKIFEERGIEVRLYIAGDLHHYRRFATEDGRYQKITAGGGGAFLHPTHDFDFTDKIVHSRTTKIREFIWRESYPEYKNSRRLDWANLFKFIPNNPTFGLVTGGVYAVLAFLIHGDLKGKDFTFLNALQATIQKWIEQPLALVVTLLLILGLVFFTDSNSKIYRRIAGPIHGILHLTAIFFLGWLSYYVMERVIVSYKIENAALIDIVWLFFILVVCGIGGYIIGSLIMGIYLFISLHWFKRHDNEAFSAMRIEDYKNFLRMHINSEGELIIYPFKIEEVTKDWVFENGGRICKPAQGKEPDPDLIEDPIRIS